MSAGRLYTVEKGEEMTIVRAMSPTQAISHVSQSQYTVHPATAEEMMMYMQAGGAVEKTKQILELEGKNADGTPVEEPETTPGTDPE